MSSGSETERDTAGTALRFTDILFGFVFKEIFFRLADWQSIESWIVRGHLVLAGAVTLGSYIGFRNSLKRGEPKVKFVNLPLLRFVTDQAMVVGYFVLATRTPDDIVEVNSRHYGEDFVRESVLIVAAILGLYLVWDLLSLWMSKSPKHLEAAVSHDWLGTAITGLFALLIGVTWVALGCLELGRGRAALVLFLVTGVVLLYRVAKDQRATIRQWLGQGDA